MKCIKCGVSISNVDKYCPRCGTLFDNKDVEKHCDTVENNLLNIYLSKKRFNSNISLGYLIFNFCYALYKKMYLEAVFSVIADAMVVSILLNWKNLLFNSLGFNALLIIFLFIIGVVVNLFYILKFDEIYITRTKSYINKLIREYGTTNMEYLVNTCEKDSKGNILIPIIIFLGIITFFTVLLLKNNFI